MSGRVGRQNGGFVVVAIPGTRDGKQPLPEWSFRHFETRDEAIEAAEAFADQKEGFEAYVMQAEAHFYNPFTAKRK